MRHLVWLLLLAGCAAQSPDPVTDISPDLTRPVFASPETELAVKQNVALLSDALESGDGEALSLLFQPPHPLAPWEPSLSTDPAWREVVTEWVNDLLLHSGSGQWQLRHLEPFAEGWRAQYRLVHDNYSVEYFYFDVASDSLSIEDMGNHLFRMSQVGMMAHLYERLLLEQEQQNQPFSRFFSTLAPFADGQISRQQFIAYFSQMPGDLQQTVISRELMLRTLVSSGHDWLSDLPVSMANRLIGQDYPLLNANLCLADMKADCLAMIQMLPELLLQDVALQTEMGIRALHRGELEKASQFATSALDNSAEYLPAHWLSLQVALGQGDHLQAIARLDAMTHDFDLPVQREVLFEVFPEAGQRLLSSKPFVQWAQGQQEP